MRARFVSQRPQSICDAELILQKPRVKSAADAYAAALRGEQPEPSLVGFNDTELDTIVRFARRQARDPFDENSFVRAWERTRPLAAFPRRTDEVKDTWFALAQPELLEDLWPAI